MDNFAKNSSENKLPLNKRVNDLKITPIIKRKRINIINSNKNKEHKVPQIKQIIKLNEVDEDNNKFTVNTISDSFTKSFMNSNSQSDIIQSALEYNRYLIDQLKNYQDLTEADHQQALYILWSNLKILSKNADYHTKSFKLSDNKKYIELAKQKKEQLLQRKKKNESGLTVIINKSILQ